MAYISGSITEESKIIVLDSSHNKIVSKDFTPDSTGYTKLLLHFDESVLVDSCATPKTLTLNGSIARSATQNKFGGYSGSFNGSNQYISIPDSEDWNFASGDFTVDFWVNFSNITGTKHFCGQYVSPTWQSQWSIGRTSDKLFIMSLTGGTYMCNYATTNTWTPTVGVWYHLSFVRNASNVYIFINGISQPLTINNAVGTNSFVNVPGPLKIGLQDDTNYLIGYMDEFRICSCLSW